MPHRSSYAAVDLGSNSFHLIIARLEHGQMRMLDRVKEMVRLAGGVDQRGRLDADTRDNALACLSRFRQLLDGIPEDNIRVAATQSFRKLRHPGQFLQVAEQALGAPIEIISGREEARLVYAGVYAHHSLPAASSSDTRRLVIDIGGGSTELAVGQGRDVMRAESLQYGCVVSTQAYFPDGRITRKRWQQAIASVCRDMQDNAPRLRHSGFTEVIGASGTIRAIQAIAMQQGWTEQQITPDTLQQLQHAMTACGHVDQLDLPGLSERRRPVLAGGVAILSALMQTMHIESMAIASAALREGLLEDMLGRLRNEDPRDHSIAAFMQRYAVDRQQSQAVATTVQHWLHEINQNSGINAAQSKLLLFAAQVHEAGLAIAHSHYQQHSAYLLQHSDLPGFSQLEQRYLAVLASWHRRSISKDWHDGLPQRLHQPAARCVALLRLAVIMQRSRMQLDCSDIHLHCQQDQLQLLLPAGWLQQHPLTTQDLLQEVDSMQPLGLKLEIAEYPTTDAADSIAEQASPA